MKEYLINTLNQLKRIREYKDEIPEEILNSQSKDIKYKCRAGFWAVLQLRLSDMESRNILSHEITQQYKELFEEYNKHKRVTPNDITKANKLIDIVVNHLELKR